MTWTGIGEHAWQEVRSAHGPASSAEPESVRGRGSRDDSRAGEDRDDGLACWSAARVAPPGPRAAPPGQDRSRRPRLRVVQAGEAVRPAAGDPFDTPGRDLRRTVSRVASVEPVGSRGGDSGSADVAALIPLVRRIVASRVPDPATAADLVQENLTRVLAAAGRV